MQMRNVTDGNRVSFSVSFKPNGERRMRVGRAHAKSLRFAPNKISKVKLGLTNNSFSNRLIPFKRGFQLNSVKLKSRFGLNICYRNFHWSKTQLNWRWFYGHKGTFKG